MRDLIKDLRKSGGAVVSETSIDIESGFVNDDALQMHRFFEQVTEIRNMIDTIAGNTKELDQLYKDNLNEPQESHKKSRTQRIDKLVTDSNKAAIQIRRKLQEMQKSNEDAASKETKQGSQGPSADLRTRQAQHSTLTNRFVQVMGAYQDVQAQSKKELRNRQKRELRIVSTKATDEELESALDNVSGPIFAQQIEMASQREEAKKLLADIQSRHEDILKLEESLKELRQLFLDMQTLVEAQGEVLDEIENQVDQAVDYTERGVQEMVQAVKYQKKARTKMFILLGCVCCLIILIIVIPTAVVLGPKLTASAATSTTTGGT